MASFDCYDGISAFSITQVEPLLRACKSGDLFEVKRLIAAIPAEARAAYVSNKYSYCDKTALDWAASGGNSEMVKMLLDVGAEVNAENYDGGI